LFEIGVLKGSTAQIPLSEPIEQITVIVVKIIIFVRKKVLKLSATVNQ